MDMQGKIIIVTGASMGIGRATAELLGEKGATIVLAARSRDKLDAVAARIPGSLVLETDMSDIVSVEKMIEKTIKQFGRVDVLINNAGRGIYGLVEKVDIDAYRKVWELNVMGPLFAMQKIIPHMRRQGGGTIVNISSMVSKNYFPRLGAYASTKYALNCLSRTMRAELQGDCVVVSVVYPGLTDTDFGVHAFKSGEETRGMESRQRQDMPDADSPEHVAGRILYAIESGDEEVFMHE